MTSQHIGAALAAVTQVETEVADKIDVVGQLVLVDVRTRKFGIHEYPTKTTYTGKVSKTAESALFSATMMQTYAARIAVIREVSAATGDEAEKYELLELTEPPASAES
jgi:hypothetical protein